MPLVYFDSTAMIKLLVDEDGSNLAANLWDNCDAALSSRLAYPEPRAALATAGRNHDLSISHLNTAEQTWEQHWAATPGSSSAPAPCAAPTPCTCPLARDKQCSN